MSNIHKNIITRSNPVVPYKLSRLAKEKGFNWKTELVYNDGEGIQEPTYKNAWSQEACWNAKWVEDYLSIPNFIPAPSHQVLQDWFKDVHNIDVWAQPYIIDSEGLDGTYSYFIYLNNEWVGDGCDFETSEEALNDGFECAFEIIK